MGGGGGGGGQEVQQDFYYYLGLETAGTEGYHGVLDMADCCSWWLWERWKLEVVSLMQNSAG